MAVASGNAAEKSSSIFGGNKHKILGEMKHQFNNSSSENEQHEIDEDGFEALPRQLESDKSTDSSSTSADNHNDAASALKQPPIIVNICKTANNKMTTRSKPIPGVNEAVKRSTRRRSKDYNESVLKSAIARKEKSYNETPKPQRLSRPLKPTPKVMENIAAAAAAATRDKAKRDGKKRRDTKLLLTTEQKPAKFDVDDVRGPPTAKCRRSGRLSTFNSHATSTNYSESDESDAKGHDVDEGEAKRMLIVDNEADLMFSSYLDADSATGQLIASRLCVCEKPTNFLPISETSIYCNAMDSINERLIGCNNWVRRESAWLLRPSTRVPYMVLCYLHRQRLKAHHCCAMCGVFCTQGSFVQCINKHLYHKHCKLSVGHLECCPHCGDTDKHINTIITMRTDQPLVYTATQCVADDAHTTSNVKKGNASESVKSAENVGNDAIDDHHVDVTTSDMPSDEELDILDDDDVEIVGEMKEIDIKDECGDHITPLIICGDLDELEKLDTKSRSGGGGGIDELFDAIKMNLYAEVANLLGSQDLDLNQLIPFGSNGHNAGTVMHYAAMHGLVPIMHMLKIADMEVNTQDKELNTPLMVAVTAFQNEAVKYLTTAGACVTTKGMDGMTALHLACKCGNLPAAKELLRAGAHIDSYINCPDDGGWTPLVWACEHNRTNVVKYLLSQEADPQYADVEGNVALHWAAFAGSIAIVELLLNFGGDLSTQNEQGDTPLHIAAKQDSHNCVVIFVTRGASLTVRNMNGETPVDCAPKGSKSRQTLLINNKLKSLINNKK